MNIFNQVSVYVFRPHGVMKFDNNAAVKSGHNLYEKPTGQIISVATRIDKDRDKKHEGQNSGLCK